MRFRERPEYRDWRAAVTSRYGPSCLLCGHVGNIHAHHVLPVADYPELALKPANGAPLCGNCHAKVTGKEHEWVDELRRRQALRSAGSAVALPRDAAEQRRAAKLRSDADLFDAALHAEAEATLGHASSLTAEQLRAAKLRFFYAKQERTCGKEERALVWVSIGFLFSFEDGADFDPSKLMRCLRVAIHLDPSCTHAMSQLSASLQCWPSTGGCAHRQEALALARRCLELNPGDGLAADIVAEIEKGQPDVGLPERAAQCRR